MIYPGGAALELAASFCKILSYIYLQLLVVSTSQAPKAYKDGSFSATAFVMDSCRLPFVVIPKLNLVNPHAVAILPHGGTDNINAPIG